MLKFKRTKSGAYTTTLNNINLKDSREIAKEIDVTIDKNEGGWFATCFYVVDNREFGLSYRDLDYCLFGYDTKKTTITVLMYMLRKDFEL